jgi:3-vinyl bacteriochlorophyllide hydratase
MHKSAKRVGNSATLGDVAPSPILCQPSLILGVSERSQTGVSRNSYVLNAWVDRLVDKVDFAPWTSTVGASSSFTRSPPRGVGARAPLYTPEERRRRDASPWTTVQGVLAPVQFGVFLVSLGLVISYLSTGEGLAAATASIVIKTLVLYAIMITGSIWERAVFGRYLFALPFFWEDVVSIGVLALHTAYLCALAFGVDVRVQMTIALLAYASYVINATQFVLKLRAARLQQGAGASARAGE